MPRAIPLSLSDAWAVIDNARCETRPKPVTANRLSKLREAIRKRHNEELPPEIADSLQIHDGGPYIESYKLLAAADIPRWTKLIPFPDHVAFAVDGGGNLLAVNERGSLVGIERDGGRYLSRFKKASSIADWLSSVARKLQRGKLVVVGGHIDEKLLQPSVTPQPATTQRLERPLADEVRSAIERGDLATLGAMLDDGRVSADARDWTETSLLAQAASLNQLELVQLLISRSCPVDIGAQTGARTALFCACWGGSPRYEIFRYLIAQGANPNAQTSYDGTPLHSAVMWEHADLAKALVAAGADPDMTDAKGQTAIQMASKLSDSRRQKMLAALGSHEEPAS